MMKDNIRYISYGDRNERDSYIDYVTIDTEAMEKTVVPVIRYKIFDGYPEVVSGFSTRHGGVSREHLSTMNLSYSRGDNKENVTENHKRFGAALGYDYSRLVFSNQVHDVKIHTVTDKDVGKGIIYESDILGIDGLITNCPNIPIMTFFADCVPLYFYDPVKHVIALAHSGWRGTVGKIGSIMVKRMEDEFGCKAGDILVAIGPSICKDCYEVSGDVAECFKNAYSDNEYDSMILHKYDDKYQLDLHLACKYNFLNAGIKPDNIAMPDICTCCNSEFLFSHRKTNGMRGNLAAVMMLV